MIFGMKAIKAKVSVEMTATLPAREVSWKKIRILMKPKTHKGINIWTKLAPGY